jgi:hypothetical protein
MPKTILVRKVPAQGLDAPHRDYLAPADAEAAEVFAKLPLGETLAVEIVRERSVRQNNLYWAILSYVAENTEWESKEALHDAVRRAIGWINVRHTPSGKVMRTPRSTSFKEMSHEEFCEYLDKAIFAICRDVLGGYNHRHLIREIEKMLGYPPLFDEPDPASAAGEAPDAGNPAPSEVTHDTISPGEPAGGRKLP